MLFATLDVPMKSSLTCFKLRLVLRCDQCSRVYLAKKAVKRGLQKASHFCSRACLLRSMSDGVLRAQIGDTLQEKYGARTPFQSSELRARGIATIVKKHGVRNAYQIPSLRQKAAKTSLEHFGVVSYWQSDQFKKLVASPEFQSKRHATMLKNGSYGKSRLEDRCFECLCQTYGQADVERQVMMNGRAIDFYVKSIDTYVQFDGAYWHGLSESFKGDVDAPRSKREEHIQFMWQVDRIQDAWFRAEGKRLVRITDVEFSRGGVELLVQRLFTCHD